MLFRLARDPWNYSSPYEQWKYEQELALLPPLPIANALELGCAEGFFTVKLATRVNQLIAADISTIALARAQQRCTAQQCHNVQLLQLDLTQDDLPIEQFDLIVCSETLYYMGNRAILQEVAAKLARSLKPNGYLITSNDYRVQSERTEIQSLVIGAEAIKETLSQLLALQLIKEVRTPYYCTHVFQRSTKPERQPELLEISDAIPLPQNGLFDWFSIAAIVKLLKQSKRSKS